MLSLPLFDRQPLQPEVEQMLADFTSILLLDMQCVSRHPGTSFAGLVRSNQASFTRAHPHRCWSGVMLQRALRKDARYPHGVPVVFTSNLGQPLLAERSAEVLGQPGWSSAQTPQVWLDHVVREQQGALCLQWDSIDALFPAGLIDSMFEAYTQLVTMLAVDTDAWHRPLSDLLSTLFPVSQRQQRRRVNATDNASVRTAAAVCLQDAFFATTLRTQGTKRSNPIAICMHQGIGQITDAGHYHVTRHAELSLPDDFSLLFGPLTVPTPTDGQASVQHAELCSALAALAHAIATLALLLGRPVRVIEVGAQARSNHASGQALLHQLTPQQIHYIGLVHASERSTPPATEADLHCDLREWNVDNVHALRHQADVICLHQGAQRLDAGVVPQLMALAAPGAMLHLLQRDVAICQSAQQRRQYQDSWLAYLQQQGLDCQLTDRCGTQSRIVARTRPVLKLADPEHLRQTLLLPALSSSDAPCSSPGVSIGTQAQQPDPAGRYRPFALTDLQQAYLTGRQPGLPLSGVGAHFFVEFDVEALDVLRFEAAWNRLIARHDMLRCVVRYGRLQILMWEDLPRFVLQHHQLDHLDGVAALALRDRLAYQVRDPGRWPLFDLQVGVDGSGHSRLYLYLDKLMLDNASIQILLKELEQLYLWPDTLLPALALNFREYRKCYAQRRSSQISLAYWQARLSSLPVAPQLPWRCDPVQIAKARFVRLSATLPAVRWDQLRRRATDAGLTPSTVLLAAFASILSGWSRRPDFTLHLSLCDRPPLHPHIDQLLGDFSSLLLLAWQPDGAWLSSARQCQQRLWQDLQHRDVSPLWLMRQLARQHPGGVGMPVMFTCALDTPQQDFLSPRSCFRPQWGISQTPQICLNHQVYESQGELCFNWDAVQALFAPEVLCAMFDQYVALLERLAQDAHAWQLSLPELIATPVITLDVPADNAMSSPFEVHPPTSTLVELVCHHFEDVVGLPITARKSFFDAGASSLKLVQLHQQLQRAGFTSLVITDLFAHTSPEALALHLLTQDTVPAAGEQSSLPHATQQSAHTMRRCGRTGHLGRGGRGRRHRRSGAEIGSGLRGGDH